ncbi:MAG: flagellar biosynthesis protein FlgA [SAR116 cluster bacterium MED-G04]|jgi:(2R)-sulfolactate sulfo-lyase subunit alpha|nr:flagellar biosynthesis protein FlgA [SAR116 cluster bacterium]OUW37083.1 MAG: flagellar biosynthesis protein FlgA [Gammaproteobacteria bacterium TMED183]PDH66590.1 MAG: flagellar biosynthesis protein FlgA [SAR116 cluster bacterium MED-G04]HCD48932.1 flagellar biosynthesis protein FlgA [Alphaproteobacteria bacterium]CAI8453885.1 MAG: (2R)-sulfolactate sulfo-lyase subunit alpha [SAR116 cluster bacterium MED-G04]|tara:strand:- start:3201 stop:3488 length:288 start_codon:yes stop_codon:yes gene_type:complete
MAEPHLLVHHNGDNVGVVVIENLKAGTEMLCVVTEDNSDFTMVVNHDVPIGHKVALVDFSAGDTVMKYGQDIGRITASAGKGDHVHVQNLKTKRW